MSYSNSQIEQTLQELENTKRLGSFIKADDPAIQGYSEPIEKRECHDGMIIHTDVMIPARDGIKLRGNIFRPETQSSEKLPVLLNYSVYGKDGALEPCIFPKGSRLDNSHYSTYYSFEACDALWWTQRGYIVAFVDARGSFQSEGDKSYYSRDVALDGYDIVEWLAAQEWANGKVGMYGASAFAMVQWQVAAEQPPSLAAIIPFDGMTDIYREMARKGGIPETQFSAVYPHLYNWGRGMVEDSQGSVHEHEFFDEYWQSKIPRLQNVKCPAYVICSWGDHAIHTRGTLNGWKQISSPVKYLEIHCYQKWEYSITEESLTRQKAFYDTYLLEKETEVKFWPPVRWTMRESFYNSEWRYAPTFPFAGTEYEKFYPTSSGGLSKIPQLTEQHMSYDAKTGEATFEIFFHESYEFAGHAKLRLWVEARGADNMDLFVVIKKFDASGNVVHFPWITVIENGPVVFGYLRVSRRELDEVKSTDFQPYHSHTRDLLLGPSQIVPVDVEILPTSCRFRAGEKLQVSISGHDYEKYPQMIPVPRHEKTINNGIHVLHFGGRYDSFLQLPGVPPVPGSALRYGKPLKMTMTANRLNGWSNDKFLEEYTEVHANMTEQLSNVVPFMRSYTQVVGVPRLAIDTCCTNQDDFEVATVLAWSSMDKFRGSFKHPSYKANAGKHVFAEPELVGSLSQTFDDVLFDPVPFRKRQECVEIVILLSRKHGSEVVSEIDLRSRAQTVRQIGRGTGLLRYVLNRDITPQDPKTIFKDTLFENGDWGTIGAMEQYWFLTAQAAAEFFADQARSKELRKLPFSFDENRTISVAGRENRVFSKDLEF